MQSKKELAVVVAAYNEEESIVTSVQTIEKVLSDQQIPHSFIIVDDGSHDRTWSKICELSELYPNINGLRFTRNFGKESAVFAGLVQATDYPCCTVIDADMQQPPEKIIEMYEKWEEGYEIVEGIKEGRQEESIPHRLFAGLFYRAISKAAKADLRNSSDFKLIDQRVVKFLVSLREQNAFFRALTFWTGYKTTNVYYKVSPRLMGKTKWSLVSLVKYSIRNIISFTTAPMHFVTFLGIIMLVISLIQGVESLVTWLRGAAAEGFTTVIFLLLFTGSIIMISLGLIGCYLGEIYKEVKSRPKYIIEETVSSIHNT